MAEDKSTYTPEQNKAIDEINLRLKHLKDYEELQSKKYRVHHGMDQMVEGVFADLEMDNYPPYSVMEERLRKAITKAQELGLGHLESIQKLEKIAFNKESFL